MIARPGLLVLGLLALAVAVVGVVTTYDGTRARAWVSSPSDNERRLLPVTTDPRGRVTARVQVEPDDRRQTWRGTGAALTDASVQLLPEASDGVARLFDPTAENGARLSWVRLPLTSTDMSPVPWTWGWDGTTASPSPQARTAVSLAQELAALQPALRVVASAWTAPEWMKHPRGIRGGALREDHLDDYGSMLVAQADALRDAEVPLAAMTLGNEPGWSSDYASMTMTDAQQAELGRQVGPALEDRGVELWAVDHNWADRPSHDAVLAAAPGAFDAAAFHCYEGRPEQMSGVDAPPIVTECSGTRGSWPETFEWDARNLVEESISAGSTGLMMWNLATDPAGGPRDVTSSEGCASCRGLLGVDGDQAQPAPEFYVLAQLRRAADPGARVIGSRSTDGVSSAAFANADGTIGVFAHNGTGERRVLAVEVAGRSEVRYDVRAGELLSLRIPG